MSRPHPTPYWRLSGVYLFYFASVGAFVPFWGLYLQSRGFGAVAIGQLMAITLATRIVAPYLWGWIADYRGRRETVIRIGTGLALISFAGVLAGSGFWWLALVMTAFSFFWNAALPQFEAATLNHLGADAHYYSRIRVWGSIGFIVTVALLAPWLARVGIEALPFFILAALAALWLMTLAAPPSRAQPHKDTHGSLLKILIRPEVAALLLACFLLQASHGSYYAFFSIYLEEHGYARTLVGQLWALGVAAEVCVLLLMHHWLPRYGARQLLLTAAMLTALRWMLTGLFADYLLVLILAQTLHAASFGLYHASAIHLIHHLFPGRLQGRGQALYSSVSFGLGGAFGSLASGYIWSGIGADAIYFFAAALAAAGWLTVWRGVRTEITAPGASLSYPPGES